MKQINPQNYKNPLKLIPGCPPRLYVRGDPEVLNQESLYICIVGSRKQTQYGEEVTKAIIKRLKPYNLVIISGLAYGIDSIALSEALNSNLRCIAVLGSGIDDQSIYPSSNVILANTIVNQGGLLVSEYPPGTKPQKWHFPLRNRIMAGLSNSIVIIEGTKKSGTMITARLGLEFDRTIICTPGSIFSELSEGPLSFISEGAIPLTHPDDILRINNLPVKEDSQFVNREYAYCTQEELFILNQLDNPKTKEELIDLSNYSEQLLQIILLRLLTKGFIEEKLSKIYRK